MLELEPEAEVGSWRLEPELDLDLEAGMGAGIGAGAEAVESSENQPGALKSALWAQTALLGIFLITNGPLGAFLAPGIKTRKMFVCSRQAAIQFPFSLGVYHSKCILSQP